MTREQFWKFIRTGIPTYDELSEEFEDSPTDFEKHYGVKLPENAAHKLEQQYIDERVAPYVYYPVTEDFSKKTGVKSWQQLKGKQMLPDFNDEDLDYYDAQPEDINDYINDTNTVDYWAPAFADLGSANAIKKALWNDECDGEEDSTSKSIRHKYDPDNLGAPAAVFATDDPDWEKSLAKKAKQWEMDAAIRKAMKTQRNITGAVQDWK